MIWKPILDGELADRARSAIAAIERDLESRTIESPTLDGGHAGIALLHGYRALDGDEAAAERASDALGLALEQITASTPPWLFHGYAGIAFALHHLAPVVGDQDDTLAELDDLVARRLAGSAWPWELMSGVIGLGVYAIERDKPELVARAVQLLAEIAVRDGDRVTWQSFYRDETTSHANLGIAHGHAGAIGFLAEACAFEASIPDVATLLRGAIAWLRDRERPDSTPRYPQVLDRPLGQPGHPGNVDGWCYGDPSTAIVLARAGCALRDRSLLDHAHELARNVVRRTDEQLVALELDSALCHGTLGQAYLANRLGQAFVDDELLTYARRSYERTLAGCDASSIAAMVAGLRAGTTGIALGLVAATSTTEPRWDRAFLVSLPVGSCVREHDVERSQ